MMDTPKKTDERFISNASIEEHLDSPASYGSELFVPRSRGMHKLLKSEGVTQQIHREDPQAGYDHPVSNTKLNGKVTRNPKDRRHGNT